MLQGGEATIRRARSLRAEMSLPERLLWAELKQKPRGIKFRRQHPSGPYVADFYCHEYRLIIELDGRAHDMGDRSEADRKRDHWFEQRGLRVVRIPAKDVLADPTAVGESILALCDTSRSPSPARGGAPQGRRGVPAGLQTAAPTAGESATSRNGGQTPGVTL